jgi:hypothetical protein
MLLAEPMAAPPDAATAFQITHVILDGRSSGVEHGPPKIRTLG